MSFANMATVSIRREFNAVGLPFEEVTNCITKFFFAFNESGSEMPVPKEIYIAAGDSGTVVISMPSLFQLPENMANAVKVLRVINKFNQISNFAQFSIEGKDVNVWAHFSRDAENIGAFVLEHCADFIDFVNQAYPILLQNAAE